MLKLLINITASTKKLQYCLLLINITTCVKKLINITAKTIN